MKALAVARKTLAELWREPLLLALLFAFPVLMVALYYVAYGETGQGLARHLVVLVLNQDEGTAGERLVGLLRASQWEGKPVFGVQQVTVRRQAETVLRERRAALLLVVPPDFSRRLLETNGTAPAASVVLVGDPTADGTVFARAFLDDLLRRLAVGQPGNADEPAAVGWEFVRGTGAVSDFEAGMPGVIAFGVVLVVISTAQALVRERVGGTLRRLRISRARSRDVLPGVTLAQTAVALITVPVTLGAAVLLGFRAGGSLLLAMGIGLLLSLSAVGLGLLTACFTRSDAEAANLGATLGVMMVLLSGAMFPMPSAVLLTVGSRTLEVYDILPPAHAAEALRRVLIGGAGIAEVGFELAALAFLSAAFLAAGVGLYQRLQWRPG